MLDPDPDSYWISAIHDTSLYSDSVPNFSENFFVSTLVGADMFYNLKISKIYVKKLKLGFQHYDKAWIRIRIWIRRFWLDHILDPLELVELNIIIFKLIRKVIGRALKIMLF
jgi:hypothetical protein